MKIIDQLDLEKLVTESGEWCISIFLPTHPVGRASQQDPIQLKNLLRQAANDLDNIGLQKADIVSLLHPIEELLQDDSFWRDQCDGLALFRSPEHFSVVRVPIRLNPSVSVSTRFLIKPLLPLLNEAGRFYVLALSQNQVRLFQGDHLGLDEIKLSGIPTSLGEALRWDDPEKQLQFQTGTSASGPAGNRPAIFHGHGGGNDDTSTNILRFFHKLDDGLGEYLSDSSDPLILAGVEYLLPIYREANTYPHLVQEGIEGHPEDMTNEELHRAAWKQIAPIFQAEKRRGLDRYRQLSGSDPDLCSEDISTIVEAAHHGRVGILFAASDEQCWGSFDPSRLIVEIHDRYRPGSVELLDTAAAYTLINSGKAFALPGSEMPDKAALAAIFRYALADGGG